MTDYDHRLDRLLGIAAEVFAQRGYHSTTMRDLARATGMSLAGIYHYVAGKDELLYLIQQRSFTQVIDGAVASVADAPTPEAGLEAFIHHHVTYFAAHMSAMKVLSHEAESLGGAHREQIDSLKRRYVAMLVDLIARLPDRREVDPSVAAFALFGMMNWIYNWYRATGPLSPAVLAQQFTRLFFHGVTTAAPATAVAGS